MGWEEVCSESRTTPTLTHVPEVDLDFKPQGEGRS